MSDRQWTLIRAETYYGPTPMPEFLEWVAETTGVPWQDLAIAVEYESDQYDGGGYAHLELYRQETQDEADERERIYAARIKQQAAHREAQERAQFEALKAKFGD